ncbi:MULTISPECIES: (2Fe-2S) ferredoxin domain-containing protein [unclassified Paenibacillus]|uniref:(2Fe-2S) ferredoxin domain-containing protein n=1 Tax=unclassified Paenibacillus TaxID=185978 RepID=UPI001AE71000|nr:MULTISPECIES: (2Fe-2S) ferredoxin domain-containing protein [unclassified Paenibacillus]MBP1154663.1 (2Fe-2S) ferredoxin [Paenibacillus sp. PvP091]MBP1169953.1 (2Fe-2S) ferredoxin [Paenibacillus sp. PvR098]MBP2440981.1 (2Fe-2S) ferredoxin [Paenibacillus sp. PvP052]
MTTWNLSGTRHHVLICNGGSCMRKGGEEVTLAIRDEIAAQGADAQIHTTRTRCNGRCENACVVVVYPEGVWYKEITPELGREVIKRHLSGGPANEELMIYSYDGEGFVLSAHAAEGKSKPNDQIRSVK